MWSAQGEKSIIIIETIQGVKPRDAIAYHTQTIYTPRKGEVSEGMNTVRKVRLMET